MISVAKSLFVALAFWSFKPGPAQSQTLSVDDYPNRSITIIVPAPVGGPTDLLARIIGDKLRGAFGYPRGDRKYRTGIHLVMEFTVVEPVDYAANRLLRVVLDMAHVRLDHIEAEVVDHLGDLIDHLLVGGDLCAQIGEGWWSGFRDGNGTSVRRPRVSASRDWSVFGQ